VEERVASRAIRGVGQMGSSAGECTHVGFEFLAVQELSCDTACKVISNSTFTTYRISQILLLFMDSRSWGRPVNQEERTETTIGSALAETFFTTSCCTTNSLQ
jgi:hypothetical protein